MAFNASEFRAALVLDGARPNLFSVNMTFPRIADSVLAGSKLTFMAKATQLPGSTMGHAVQHYFGRAVKVAGDRVFGPWAITVINDEDFFIRSAFERWMDSLNSHQLNIRSATSINLATYSSDATVTQYAKQGIPAKVYKFTGMFPTAIDPINLNWGQNDTIEEFNVTFQYQHWVSDSTT